MKVELDVCISVVADNEDDVDICVTAHDVDGNYQFLPLGELVSELLDAYADGSVEDLEVIAAAFRRAATRIERAVGK